jgi:alpha-2-macroglobulin
MQRWAKITLAAGLAVAVAGSALWYATARAPQGTVAGPGQAPDENAEVALAPAAADPNGVDPAGSFLLTSDKPLKLETVQAELTVQPAVPLKVAARSSREFVVQPARTLDANRVYRFRLAPAAGVSRPYQWSFQTRAAFRILSTLPRNRGDSVGVNTGIEITFSHENYADPSPLFSISPAVAGRFERHKQTWVFVPQEQLQYGTIYTVTLKRGLAQTEGDGRLTEDYTFAFETVSQETPQASKPYFQVPLGVQEYPVGDTPYFLVYTKDPTEPVTVDLYQYPSAASFAEALVKADKVPWWAYYARSQYSEAPTGLGKILSFKANLREVEGMGLFLNFPQKLDAGYYLADVVRGSSRAQARLQVTDIASYTAVTTRGILVWLNDLQSKAPIAGAKVSLSGGASVTTDASGVAVVETPAGLTAEGRRAGVQLLARVDGKEAVISLPSDYWSGGYTSDRSRLYWRYLYLDRPLYKPDDTINLFGLIKPREPGAAPVAEVALKVTRGGYYGPDQQPISLAQATLPVQDGTFTGNLTLPGLEPGWYEVALLAGPDLMSTQYFEVQTYTKPAYQLAVTTDRKAVYTGDPVTLTAKAAFFEGTPVPDLSLGFSCGGESGQFVTGQDGAASVTVQAPKPWEGYRSGPYTDWCTVRAVLPEAGEITGQVTVQVFGADMIVSPQVQVEGAQAVISGDVKQVDIAAANAGAATYLGAPVLGRELKVTLIEENWEKVPMGEYYDFLQKQVVQRYDYRPAPKTIGTYSATTGEDGRFSLSVPVMKDKSYWAEIAGSDSRSRTFSAESYFSGTEYQPYYDPWLYSRWIDLGPADDQRSRWGLSEEAELLLRQNRTPVPGRKNGFLFYMARLGVQEYHVQDTPRYSYRLKEADLPNTNVRGVYFDGRSYAESGEYTLLLDAQERALKVSIKTDKASYRPGETVNVNVAVTDRQGKPIKAQVNLNAVDEALFALQDQQVDLLNWLYGWPSVVPSGVMQTRTSHEVPRPGGGAEKGGDGGGVRRVFKDAPFFRTVTTDGSGKASVSFAVPDNLTSWRLTWQAVEPGTMQAASGTLPIAVTLPFFVETVQSETYLVGDKPAVTVRTYGTGLSAGQTVKLGGGLDGPRKSTMTDNEAKAFQALLFRLPALTEPGTYKLTVLGEGPGGLKDAVEKEFQVAESYLRQNKVSFFTLEPGMSLPQADQGVATLLFSDYERGQYLHLLNQLRWQWGNRFDQKLSRKVAADLAKAYFKLSESAWATEPELDTHAYQLGQGGIGILPYADADLLVSVLAADLLPTGFDQINLESYFRQVLDSREEARERQVLALYGMAALDRPVLQSAYALLKAGDLTLAEKLYLTLAVAELGDLEGVRPLYRAILTEHGEQLGAAYRIRTGRDQDEILTNTALAGVLAAKLGESQAPGMAAYLSENPGKEVLLVLQEALMAQSALPQLGSAPVSFTLTVAGQTINRELKPGESFSTAIPAKSLAGLAVKEVKGKVGLTVLHEEPLARADLQQQAGFSLTRRYEVVGGKGDSGTNLQVGSLVLVTLTWTIPDTAPGGGYEVSDYLPSGLRLMQPTWQQLRWDKTITTSWPIEVNGQKVTFWASKDVVQATYYARVMSPGDYTAEEPVLQHQRSGIIYGHGERQQVEIE